MHNYFILTWGITNFLLLVSCIFGVKKYSTLRKEEKQYIIYIVFLFIIEGVTNLLTQYYNFENTSFLYPIYIVGEFLILSNLFIKKLNLSKYCNIPILILTLGFIILNQFFSILSNEDYGKVISNVIIICFCGFVLLQEIKGTRHKNRFLLVDACMFFYYAVSVFVFIIQNQIAVLNENDYYMILGVNNILSSILYCSIVYTFLKLKK
ncbi:hypothetical protein SAMN05421682_10792 [Chryseobacterium indoltheticum]|uniref:Uncharacterized protein n=1 Tax=Chryseobacterium indoltheticum TaxID=254 RepID=A0A381JSM9_9FLAO|nr:hypothetical protein [Chryseobacterium indoltheticum]AZA75445.1 hypothetical protein EG358_17535 [Chryseobacterium indoltheticum]SIQ67340.1 hypothetical protein SAMN05421682_10792 [Chryseobacterium indoltheticum]SUY53554.1 Uncharacterised protein [Chryseobacterium indoltheticum]